MDMSMVHVFSYVCESISGSSQNFHTVWNIMDGWGCYMLRSGFLGPNAFQPELSQAIASI